jgi:transposase
LIKLCRVRLHRLGVLDGCRADVSFIAGMIIDKFAYHQPLYRQHVKLQDSGINVSRAWITKLMSAAVSLVEPIFSAQLESVRRSRVIAMDETPIKAGRAGPGKMKAAYFWPVVGEQDEICFLYYPSRAAKNVETALGLQRPNGAVLRSDGYNAYEHYAKKIGITHAQCWAHARRKIFDARGIEPAQGDQALHAIAALYNVEQQIRDDGLTGQAKLVRRQEQSKPVLDRFFAWIDEQFDKQGFLPSSPFLGALAYIRERRVGLTVYLDDPEVSIDTNHLERALRVIPMGKKNWLFSWTELGAKHVGIVQSLLTTVGCTTSTRTITSWTYCSVSVSTRRHWCISLRRGFGRRCSPRIRCGRTCITFMGDMFTPPRDRVHEPRLTRTHEWLDACGR